MERVQFLQTVHAFATLNYEDLERLAVLMRRQDFRRNQMIFQQGESGLYLY